MKKFRFRLERVLGVRQARREELRAQLMLKNTALREAQEVLEGLEQALIDSRMQENVIMRIGEVQLVGDYRLRLKDAIISQGLKVMQAEKERDEALKVYIEAAKEAKSLEMLRAKKLEEYKGYVLHEEEKFLDEVNTQRRASSRANRQP